MATIEEHIDQLIAQGLSIEQITKKVKARSTKVVKDHLLADLYDVSVSPVEFAAVLKVNSWPKLSQFFTKRPDDAYHPQRIFKELGEDIDEAIAEQKAQALMTSMLLFVKGLKQ